MPLSNRLCLPAVTLSVSFQNCLKVIPVTCLQASGPRQVAVRILRAQTATFLVLSFRFCRQKTRAQKFHTRHTQLLLP